MEILGGKRGSLITAFRLSMQECLSVPSNVETALYMPTTFNEEFFVMHKNTYLVESMFVKLNYGIALKFLRYLSAERICRDFEEYRKSTH